MRNYEQPWHEVVRHAITRALACARTGKMTAAWGFIKTAKRVLPTSQKHLRNLFKDVETPLHDFDARKSVKPLEKLLEALKRME